MTSRKFSAPSGGQQEQPGEIAPEALHGHTARISSSVSTRSRALGAAMLHFDGWRAEVVVSFFVPREYPARKGQRRVCRPWTTLVFDRIEHADHIAAPNILYGHVADGGENETLKDARRLILAVRSFDAPRAK